MSENNKRPTDFTPSRPWPEERRKAQHGAISQLEDYIDERLERRSAETREYFDNRFDEVTKLIKSGYPGGDLEGHRLAHEVFIREAERRAKFRDAVIEKTLTALVWFALSGVALAVWNEFKKKVGS